jgi:hypothetical protein
VDVRRYSSAFTDIDAMQATSVNMRVSETPERIPGQLVSPSFFKLLRVEAQLGRTFLPEEEQQGQDSVVVMSQDYGSIVSDRIPESLAER